MMNLSERTLLAVLDRLLPDATDFLGRLISIPSVRGGEGPVNRLVHQVMGPLCDTATLMQIPESFKDDPGYSWPLPGLSYQDTQNVRLTLAGTRPAEARSVLFNCIGTGNVSSQCSVAIVDPAGTLA